MQYEQRCEKYIGVTKVVVEKGLCVCVLRKECGLVCVCMCLNFVKNMQKGKSEEHVFRHNLLNIIANHSFM